MKALLELLKNIVVFLSGYLTALYLNSENQTFEDNIIRKPKITKEDCEKLMRYAIVSLVFGDIIGGSIQIHETKKYIKHVEK